MSDLNSLRGAGRPNFLPPPAVPPLAAEPEVVEAVVPEAAPLAGPQGGERLLDAGAAEYGAMPWDEAQPPGTAVERAKAWGQRLIQGL